MKSVQGGSNIAYGTYTVTSGVSNFDITHNLNSANYIVLVRRKTPIILQDICNAAILIGGITTLYNVTQVSAVRSAVGNTIESRVGTNYYVGSMANPAQTSAYYQPNSCRVYARNGSYPFKAGDYEWIAIDLDSVADSSGALTFSQDTSSYQVTDNLGTTSKIALLTKDTASYNVGCWNTCLIVGDYFLAACNNEIYYYSGFEARTTWTDYTSNINNSSASNLVASNSVTFAGRGYGYPFLAGDYHYKIFKI